MTILSLRNKSPRSPVAVGRPLPFNRSLLSALLPGEHLRLHHVLGALIALAGTVLLFAARGINFAQDYLPGFAAAFVAFTFASGRQSGAITAPRSGRVIRRAPTRLESRGRS